MVTVEAAEGAVRIWIDSQMRIRTLEERIAIDADPLVYRIIRRVTDKLPLMTAKGPIELPPEATRLLEYSEGEAPHIFFVDENPRANWEHACSYVFVGADKSITAVQSTVPPSAKTKTSLIPVSYRRPADLAR